MTNDKPKLLASDEEKRKQSEARFHALLAECLDEGWSPTKCPTGCVVEPDGICPHNFKNIALEFGLI